ncbi:MAG: glycosyltransferase family 39 protein [Candidatus Levyibacteriota bacterium]
MKRTDRLILIIIIIIAAAFRIYGLNWDQGFHLHPDERAITMFVIPLQFPRSIFEFLSLQSSWNPHFFAYGSFPLYFLKIFGQIASAFNQELSGYSLLNLLGRYLSVFFDLGTLIFIFLLTRKIFNQTLGFIAAFFYAISVFSIQAAHFYAVDTPLTFFVLITLYQLIRFYEKPSKKNAIVVGIFFGLSLATKNSALVLLSSIGLSLTADFFLILFKNPHRPHIWFPHFLKFVKSLINDGVIIGISTLLTFLIFEPYALLDFKEFYRQTMQQYQMTHDAFTFPYTLQYVGKIPYFYELKNIFLWGQGPILAILSFLGALYFTFIAIKKSRQAQSKQSKELIIAVFFWSYFLTVGNFAIGFMRYMLPLYPLFCIFAAVIFYRIFKKLNFENSLKIENLKLKIIFLLMIMSILIWPLAFMHIYTQPNTRVSASNWIIKNIPQGKTLAIEHWDDSLPLFGQEKYKILILPLYDPDTEAKWSIINQTLSQTDYIVIASNRLYIPLQKLTDCNSLPPGRCYKETADYYKRLFNEQNVISSSPSLRAEGLNLFQDLNQPEIPKQVRNDIRGIRFQKVAEFTSYPTLETRNLPVLRSLGVGGKLEIDDSSADESFTVYDHPKIIIFKKI